MKLKSGYETKKARVEMLPLIDVVFLLLVFFIYAMVSMVVHHGMGVNLPSVGQVSSDNRAYLSITIDAENNIQFGDQAITLDSLTSAVKAGLTEQGAETPIYIEGDQAADLGLAVQILNQLQLAGIEKVSFACKKAP